MVLAGLDNSRPSKVIDAMDKINTSRICKGYGNDVVRLIIVVMMFVCVERESCVCSLAMNTNKFGKLSLVFYLFIDSISCM